MREGNKETPHPPRNLCSFCCKYPPATFPGETWRVPCTRRQGGSLSGEEKTDTTEMIPCCTVPDGHLKTSSGAAQGPPRPLCPAVRLIPPPPTPAPPRGAFARVRRVLTRLEPAVGGAVDSKALQPPSCTPAAPPSRAPGAPGQRREVRRQQRPGGTVAGPHPMPRGAGLWGRGDQGENTELSS